MPFLKRFPHQRGFTHGSYTLPAHEAFFASKLPHNFSDRFDVAARSGRKLNGKPLWRLVNNSRPGPGKFQLKGENIVDGFNQAGFHTIGSGGVGWFDIQRPAHISAISNFEKFAFFGVRHFAKKQIKWCLEQIRSIDDGKPFFLFINFGETHHPYTLTAKETGVDWAHGQNAVKKAQVRCAEYLDEQLSQLFTRNVMKHTNAIVCADHGDCMGEDGLFGHGFYHPKVFEIPIVEVNT